MMTSSFRMNHISMFEKDLYVLQIYRIISPKATVGIRVEKCNAVIIHSIPKDAKQKIIYARIKIICVLCYFQSSKWANMKKIENLFYKILVALTRRRIWYFFNNFFANRLCLLKMNSIISIIVLLVVFGMLIFAN